MRTFKFLLSTAAAIGLCLAMAPQAEASIVITASDTITSATADDSATPGSAVLSSIFAGSSITTVIGSGLPILTLPELMDVGVTITVARASAAHPITIKVTQTDLPGAPGLASFLTEFTGSAKKGTVTRSTWIDPANGGAEALLIGGGSLASFEAGLNNALLTGPFSVTEEITFTATADGALLSIDDVTSRVPEPGTLALLGLGLVGAGLARRRRA